jgi:hypothetical protein
MPLLVGVKLSSTTTMTGCMTLSSNGLTLAGLMSRLSKHTQWQCCPTDTTTKFAGIVNAMACYSAVEDGLNGDASQIACSQRVFPNLNKIQNAAVSRKLTDCIQKYIPQGVSNDVRNSFSAKSMRKGAINYMAGHVSCKFYESHVCSGHSLGTSQENYIDRKALVLSVTAGKAISSFRETSFYCNIYHPPGFDILGLFQQENVEKIIDELYCISGKLSQFRADGHLWPFLRIATAWLFMSLEGMIKDFGHGNKVVRKIFAVAETLNLKDPINAPPHAISPGHVMLAWAKK